MELEQKKTLKNRVRRKGRLDYNEIDNRTAGLRAIEEAILEPEEKAQSGND